MSATAGIDVGSTYTKAVVVDAGGRMLGRALRRTGFRLAEVAERVLEEALAQAGLARDDLRYMVSTGFGRHQVGSRDANATDLTATARAALHLCGGGRTVLDVGGQTMKASRIDSSGKVRSFRLNDKCAAGTGAFLEKTARYMGYATEEIGALALTSKESIPISGVCAVFAESEVINHLSQGCAPADIMRGAMASLVDRAVQLMKRIQMEPDFVLVGGILRFETMVQLLREKLGARAFIAAGDLPQYAGALGAALLGQRRIQRLAAERSLSCSMESESAECQRGCTSRSPAPAASTF